MAANQGFPREHRVRRGADYKRIYERKCRASDDVLLVYGRSNGLPHARLGLSVSRKVGPAVCRNRWKRLIREAFRLNRARLPEGLDLVVLPRAAATPELTQVQRSLVDLAWRVARRLHKEVRQPRDPESAS